MVIARLRKNQTGVENRVIKMDQLKEFFVDYKSVSGERWGLCQGGDSWGDLVLWFVKLTWSGRLSQYMFFFLGFVSNVPNGGISNVSTPSPSLHSAPLRLTNPPYTSRTVLHPRHQRSRLQHSSNRSPRHPSRSHHRHVDRSRCTNKRLHA